MDFLPLHSNANIHEGNALRIEWRDIISPSDNVHIMGNPPFIGARVQNPSQKNDIADICLDSSGVPIKRSKLLDYVSGWYFKAANYIKGTKIQVAFVSTNSICQGEQVPIMWKSLKESYNIYINFAYQTFNWDSEASEKAHVHCVIIGFANFEKKDKYIFSNGSSKHVSYINSFLLDAPECFIKRLTKPLSDVPQMSMVIGHMMGII